MSYWFNSNCLKLWYGWRQRVGGGGGGGGGGGPPRKLQVVIYFLEEKLVRTSIKQQFDPTLPTPPPPPPPPPWTYIFIFIIASSRFLELITLDSADAQADLRLLLFACKKVEVPATSNIRNGVNKANPDKMSRSSQRSFLFKCQIMLNLVLINYNAIGRYKLSHKQDAFSDNFFLISKQTIIPVFIGVLDTAT